MIHRFAHHIASPPFHSRPRCMRNQRPLPNAPPPTRSPNGLITNGTTGSTSAGNCAFIPAGYYNSGNATQPDIQPCAINTTSPVQSLATAGNCAAW